MANELRAVHTNGQDYGRVDVAKAKGRLRPEQLDHLKSFVSTVYETEHPVVRIHPETDEPALLLGGFAQRLVGHQSAETTDILRTLQSYVTRRRTRSGGTGGPATSPYGTTGRPSTTPSSITEPDTVMFSV